MIGDRFAFGSLRSSPSDLFEGEFRDRRGRLGLVGLGGCFGQPNSCQVGIIEHDHPLDQVIELSNVPGESVLPEAIQDGGGDRESISTVELCVALDEIISQQRDLDRTLAQRWDEHVNYVEPIEEILSEPTLCDGALQILIGGSENPYVDRQGRLTADA